MSIPRVSIVMPTYNRRGMIKEAIESVRAQSFEDWELIIVDDGSTDGTLDLVRSSFGEDERIICLEQNHEGVVSVRRLGIRHARGEFLGFLDDDDAFYPEKLAHQVAFLEANPSVGLVYSLVDIVDRSKNHISVWPENPANNFRELVEACTIQPNALLVRSHLFKDATALEARLRGCDDYFHCLYASLKMPIAVLRERVGFYRHHGSRISNNLLARMKNNIAVCSLIAKEKLSRDDRKACMKRLAKDHYELASHLLDEKRWLEATQNFFQAIRHNPAVGLQVRWARFQTPLYRLLKPYGAVVLTFIRSITSFAPRTPYAEKAANHK